MSYTSARYTQINTVIVQAVLSLYDDAKTRVRVGSAYSEEFKVKVGVSQGLCIKCIK